MKKFLSKFALILLCIFGLTTITAVSTIGVMSAVHDQTFVEELCDRLPIFEKVFKEDEKSKDKDIVIEDETETSGETTDEGTSTEGTEQTEETQS